MEIKAQLLFQHPALSKVPQKKSDMHTRNEKFAAVVLRETTARYMTPLDFFFLCTHL